MHIRVDWYDYGARFYDPQIGRWTTQDPLAEIVPNLSAYHYGYNNPIRFFDVDGLYSVIASAPDQFPPVKTGHPWAGLIK